MKRITISLALAVLIVGGTIAAGQQHFRARGAAEGPSRDMHAQLVSTFLGLNDQQKAVFTAAMQDFDATRQSLETKQRDLAKQEHDLVASGSNDAAAIGALVLQQRAIGDQIKAAHETLKTKLEAVLTPEQKVRAEALHAAMELMHHGPEGPGAMRHQ